MNLTPKEEAVLEAIRAKIDSRIEAKADKADIDLVQKQLDRLFERTDPINRPANAKHTNNTVERKEAREFLVKFFKGQPMEQKLGFSDYHATDPDAQGGYLVPELLMNEIAHYVLESGVARQRMRYMPFSGPGNTRKIPKEISGVSVQWVSEFGQKPLTTLTLDVVVQSLEKLAAIAIITESLIEDAGFDLVDYVARRIGEAIAREEDRVYFVGDIGAGDPFDGILNATGVVPSVMAAAASMDDITADDLLSAIYSIPKEARQNAAFYFHSDILFQLQKLRADGATGEYLIQRPINGGEPPRLWGYPVYTVDVLPSLDEDEADLPFGIFSNLQKTCVYGDKDGLRVKLLTEATLTDGEGNSINLAQNDAVAVRVHKRTGYACLHPEGIAILTTGSAT